MSIKYRNRYGDIFTFTKDQDGNVLWEGNFEYCRVGFPNVYNKAYDQYVQDGGSLDLEEFEIEVHKASYDPEAKYIGMSEISQKYASLVYSDKDTIDMVDPSGGPYMGAKGDLGILDEEFNGLIIERFEKIDTGYKIIVKH